MLILPSFAFAVDYWQNLEDVGADFGYVCPVTANTPNCDTAGLSTVTSSSAFLKMDSQNGYKWFNFLWFNVASPILPNAGDVDKVYLWMYRRPSLSGLPASWVYMDMREVKFTSGITWQIFASNNSQTAPPVPAQYFYCAADNTWCTVDITAQYKAWRAGQYPNGGFFMQSSVSSGYSNWFSGPKTVVDPAWKPRLQFQLKAGVNPPVTAPVSSSPTKFLAFPLQGLGPYSPGRISSVVDHDVPHDLTQSINFTGFNTSGPFGYNGTALSFTGELFTAGAAPYNQGPYQCYKKLADSSQTSTWSSLLQSVYVGTTAGGCTVNVALNYDNHPGYDYAVAAGTNVYPAAPGNIIFTKCIKTFANNSSCEDYGAVAIDHGNGFVTQYLHMSNVYYGSAANGVNQPVNGGTSTVLGKVSNVGVPANGAHLHFEVLQRKATPVNQNNYYDRANYIIVDPYGYKAGAAYQDKLLANPGCLWAVGCQY